MRYANELQEGVFTSQFKSKAETSHQTSHHFIFIQTKINDSNINESLNKSFGPVTF